MDTLELDIRVPLRSFAVDVAVQVGRGTLALAGPSGAGKTTVLRAIAGLVRPSDGRIAFGADAWFDSDQGLSLAPELRSVGLVFQDYALFPHLSVRQNVAFGSREPVDDLLDRFGIAMLAHARPAELSGGERQRVALARALARQPQVLLLDEPLAALDAATRRTVRDELRALLDELALPTLLVTHDFEDAAALSSRVGVIVDGKLVQVDEPARLVQAPADPFVASFTGGNLVPGVARPGPRGLTEITTETGAKLFSTDRAEGRVGVVVRPWEITVAREAPADSSLNHIGGTVGSLIPVGNRVRVRIGEITAELTLASLERLRIEPGERVVGSFKASATRLVPLASGAAMTGDGTGRSR